MPCPYRDELKWETNDGFWHEVGGATKKVLMKKVLPSG